MRERSRGCSVRARGQRGSDGPGRYGRTGRCANSGTRGRRQFEPGQLPARSEASRPGRRRGAPESGQHARQRELPALRHRHAVGGDVLANRSRRRSGSAMAPEPGLYGRCGLEGPHHDQRLGHGGASGVGVRDDAPELPRRGTRPAAGVQRPQHSVIAGRRRRGRVGREREDRDPRLHERRLDGIDVQLRGGGLGSVGHVPAGTAGVPHPSAVRRLLRRGDDDGEPGVRQRLPEHGAGRGVRLPARPAALGLWPDVREHGRRSDRRGDRRLRLGDDRRRRDPLLQHLRADRAVLGG